MTTPADIRSRAWAWARRTFWLAVVAGLLVLTPAGTASAAEGGEPKAQGSLSWIKVKDAHGHSIWDYQLSMDDGGITHPARMVWYILVQIVWVIYQSLVGIACWLIEWTLSMDWIRTLAGPVMVLGDSLQSIVDRFGFAPTLLTITACAVAVWIMRGKWALGIFELFMSLVIASLAVGALANPVRLVAGEDGLLDKARDTGVLIAVGLKNDGDVGGNPDELVDELVGSFAHTFLRGPHQAVNFARIIDGSQCEKTYDKYLGQSDLWERMEDCNSAYGEVPGNPNPLMFRDSFALIPAGFIVVLFAGLLCLGMLIAGCWALFQSLKMIIALVVALLPGGGRGSLWMTFADLAIALVTLGFTSVFLSAYLLLVQQVFAVSTEGGMKAFYILDILLVVGMVIYWKARKRLKSATANLAAAMSKRPGGKPSALPPARKEFSATELYYKGKLASEVYRGARGAASALSFRFRDPNRTVATGVGPASSNEAGGPPPGTDPGASPRPGPGAGDPNGPVPAPAGGGGRDGSPAGVLQMRLEQRRPRQSQQLLNVASTAILAGATGGTSAVAGSLVKQGAARAAAQTARRTMVKNKLNTGATLQLPQVSPLVSGPPAAPGTPPPPARRAVHPAPTGPRRTHEILREHARGPATGTDDARAAAAARLQQRLAQGRATARKRPGSFGG